MDVTPRVKQIFQVLLREKSAISVKYLAEQIHVSKRTVQRELESIQKCLKGYELRFLSKTGVGIWLEGEESEKQRFFQDICQGDSYDMSNREERRKRLILEVLKEKGVRKLFYYSSQFGVSETTVSTDLEAVEVWLSQYGIVVKRKPGSGIEAEGSEESYRKAIRAFINENMDTRVLREAYEETGVISEWNAILKKSRLGNILNGDIMQRVMDCIRGMENKRVMTLTENSYMGLIIHISIAINRILKNEVIEFVEDWNHSIKQDEDYQLAQAIVKELEEEFEIPIPQEEVSYICLHLKGAKHEKIRWNGTALLEMETREMQRLVNDMIDAFDTQKAYLLKQDNEFIQGLLAHLQPTLIRITHGMRIQNPMLSDIKNSYPDIYEKSKNAARVLEEKVEKEVPEEEIGFLTVHFGAAMVRLEGKKEQLRKVHVGVICSSGIGISRLMSSKLEKTFKQRVEITAYGARDITPYIVGKTDFFVSSLPLEPQEIPVVYVNPLLNEVDMEKIQQLTFKYERMPDKHREADEFSVQLEEINLMAAQINTIIKYMKFFKVDNRISFEELLIAVGEQMSPYSDRQEMIQDDIRERERISSQIFAEFGFALLHARTKGVIRPEFAVCMTKDLGAFEDPYMKQIKAVFVMLIPEDANYRINSDILGYISSLFIEENGLMETVFSGDREEIRTVLSHFLKTYFKKYVSDITQEAH